MGGRKNSQESSLGHNELEGLVRNDSKGGVQGLLSHLELR